MEHTPEQYAARAEDNIGVSYEKATMYASLGILAAMLQMEICGHGTRGYCKDCLTLTLNRDVAVGVK